MASLTPDDWQRVKQVLLDALELEGPARETFLDRACAGDAVLRSRVDLLLSHHAQAGVDGFLGEFEDLAPAVSATCRDGGAHQGEGLAMSADRKSPQPRDSGSEQLPNRPQTPRKTPRPEVTARENPLEAETLPPEETSSIGQTRTKVGRLPDQFGRYRILKLLGEGGMGAVYLAEDPQLDRRVALKVPFFGEDQGSVLDRFRREAKAIAAIQHPNICPIYEVAEVNGIHYMAMAFIQGKPLSEAIRPDKTQSIRAVVTLVRKLALALHEAHRHGVIHRDLKPANILINERKEPVIMDFGLARRAGRDDTQLTKAGQLMGTPSYMPPEQVSGDVEAMGPACDIYSLGVILYQLLTGRVPFEGDLLAVLSQIALDPPKPPSTIRPDVDPPLDAICLQALAKNPADRFGSMAELAQALADYLQTGATPHSATVPATPPPPIAQARPTRRAIPRWARIAVATVLLAVFLLAATVIYLNTGEGQLVLTVNEPDVSVKIDGQPQTIEITSPRDTITVKLRPGQHALEVTKDGFTTVTRAFSITRRNKTELTVELRAPEDARGDGRATSHSLFDELNPTQIPEVEQSRGQPEELVAVLGSHRGRHWWVGIEGGVSATAFSGDGKLVASAGKDGTVRVWDAQTMRQLQALEGHGPLLAVQFAPNLRFLVSGDTGEGRIWDLSGSEPKLLKALGGQGHWIEDVAVTADSKTVAVASQNGVVRMWDLSGTEPQPHSKFPQLGIPGEHLLSMAMSPDGRYVAFGTQGELVWLHDLGGANPTEPVKLPGHRGMVNDLAFSPDGTVLASGGGFGGDNRVLLWRVDGEKASEPQVLGSHDGFVHAVAFSADGKLVASGSNDLTARVWSVDAPGNEPLVLRETSPTDALAFAPDGKTLAVGCAGGLVRLWDLAAQPPRPKWDSNGHAAAVKSVAISADGSLVASGSFDGTVRLWQFTAAGPQDLAVLNPQTGWVRAVAISPAGKLLAAAGDRESTIHLWSLDEPQPKPREGATGHPGGTHSLALSPDGSRLASCGADNSVRVWDTGLYPQVQHEMSLGDVFPYAVAVSRSGRLLAVAPFDGQVRLWQLAGDKPTEMAMPAGHERPVLCVAFAPDSDRLVSGDDAGVIRLWEVADGAVQATGSLTAHAGAISSVAVSPDGQTLASADHRGQVILWDLASRRAIKSLAVPGPIFSLAYAPDGRHLVTGNSNGTLYVLRIGRVAGLSGHE